MNEKTSQVIQSIRNNYGAEAEYPFLTSPQTAVFRNGRTGKWFAVLLGSLPKRCLGLAEDGEADVLNLKCDPIMTFSLIDHQRIFRAYHMNKEHWISVCLDSDIGMEELSFLIDVSYGLVDKRKKRKTEKQSGI